MTSDPLTIRVATPGDAGAVGALLRESYPVLMRPAYGEALSAVLDVMVRANPDLLASGSYYVAESERGCVVGAGGWTRERPGDGAVEPAHAHLRHFATHPRWCRRGVARRIYERCEVRARETGIRCLECYSSLNAVAFYAALGFETVAGIDVTMGEGRSLAGVLMRRRI